MNTTTHYILRHAKTGHFFNGTNFSEENAHKATRFDAAPAAESVRLVWDCPVQVIAITSEQVAKLDLSDELDARADAHRAEARVIERRLGAAYTVGKNAAATRLSQRATRLAVEVYATFPRIGHAVAA